ncbi:mitochondrial 54S ribosomal protein mL40 [Lachancea thermotolerans CBS 6340]|uniref:Large ribosomal subunit protein mL40 n=1 Tax=Lachancea thermotolerans (strain ATCC 56472 / CBS 6340 / NRRL Y-8284) TaxID=559295 RepID=C5DM10_LACTC|nr:mitochondrial 54S ribosomal protein YmL28 [Lachancea thermotolerans CBS 6340]CAR24821.1 KLTH0G05060p [Lachancea thermotolerans CBS 6340]
MSSPWSNNSRKLSQPVLQFVRGKRTKAKGALSPAVQRVITQLSVMSAGRKQPKMLKLSREDLIKHQTIQNCWSMYQRELREKRNEQLRLQYKSTEKAMTLLEQLDPELFEAANASEAGKRFPLELKVPTEFPPDQVWYYNYKPKEEQ